MLQAVAIIGAGSMGAGIGGVLHRHGVKVLSPLNARSQTSRLRALEAGIIDAGLEALGEVDIILSIVPPSQAEAAAGDVLPVLEQSRRKPVYVDCNAITPDTSLRIAAAVEATGTPYVDAGIIGLPPGTARLAPLLYLSGPHIASVAGLGNCGLQLAPMQGMPVGAASALKLAYAGVTKGLVGLAASMALAAEAAGVSDYFRAELERSQPHLHDGFSRSVPDMLGKAGRWVAEMEGISDFSGRDIHRQLGALYAEVAADPGVQDRLRAFYAKRG